MSQSIHDRLRDLQARYHSSSEVYKEIDHMLSDMDDLDNDLRDLQVDLVRRPLDYTQFKLGQISQKLY